MKSELFALVDCNNFYVSCERVFNPALRHKPVMVLSNNDGCVIARSPEVKALGIAMGAPAFSCRSLIQRHNIHVYSSNFALYGDMSARVMQTLQELVPEMEVYSIDEAFIRLTHLATSDVVSFCRTLQQTVYAWTGIPISIGIGPTKTLAKVANKIAKKIPEHSGVYDIRRGPSCDAVLEMVPVRDIWGIGSRYADLLKRHSITNARQLICANDAWIKKHMTIAGLRTVWELRGTACLMLEEHPSTKKSIAYTRSFGRRVTEASELKEIFAEYAAQLGCKLRKNRLQASSLYVFVMTSRHTEYRYYASRLIALPSSTSYTPDLIRATQHALSQIYQAGYIYRKAGIIALDFTSEQEDQLSLVSTLPSRDVQKRIMRGVDAINKKWGRRTVLFAAQGLKQPWSMVQAHKSPAFTTSWHDLPSIFLR